MALFLCFQSVVLHLFTWRKSRAEEEKRENEVGACGRGSWYLAGLMKLTADGVGGAVWVGNGSRIPIDLQFFSRKAFLKGKPTTELLHCDKSN